MSLSRRIIAIFAAIGFGSLVGAVTWAETPPAPKQQTEAKAQQNSAGCMSCHTKTDSLSMHSSPGVILGCTDCHGGNAGAFVPAGAQPGSAEYRQALDA